MGRFVLCRPSLSEQISAVNIKIMRGHSSKRIGNASVSIQAELLVAARRMSEPRTQRSGVSGGARGLTAYSASTLRARLGRACGAATGKNLEQACTHCGAVGQMQTLERPDGNWMSFQEVCPLCGGPMPALYDDTVHRDAEHAADG